MKNHFKAIVCGVSLQISPFAFPRLHDRKFYIFTGYESPKKNISKIEAQQKAFLIRTSIKIEPYVFLVSFSEPK
jgi:hypothetical protein